MIARAQPRLDAEDHAALLRLSSDSFQPPDDLRLTVRVVAQITTVEEREQDNAGVQRARDVDAVADPLLGARIRFVGDLVQHVERDATNAHAGGLRGVAVPALHIGLAQVQVALDVPHRDLRAVEAELPRQRHGACLPTHADRPVARADVEPPGGKHISNTAAPQSRAEERCCAFEQIAP